MGDALENQLIIHGSEGDFGFGSTAVVDDDARSVGSRMRSGRKSAESGHTDKLPAYTHEGGGYFETPICLSTCENQGDFF